MDECFCQSTLSCGMLKKPYNVIRVHCHYSHVQEDFSHSRGQSPILYEVCEVD